MSHVQVPPARRFPRAHGSTIQALAALCALGLGGCLFPNTQRWPPPMGASGAAGGDPRALPPGDVSTRQEGPEEVTVVRHADPVRVRPVGTLSGQPLAFYDKRMRANAGSSVIVSPGGRAEILWPSGSSVVLFGKGVAWVGSTGRGEPMLDFQELDRARLVLQEGDRVRLMGGAELAGSSGPYVVERAKEDRLDVKNQSKSDLLVSFREELFTLGPGQHVIVPLLSEGGTPIRPDPAAKSAAGPGFSVRLTGDVEPRDDAGTLEFTAAGEGSGGTPPELIGLGQRVRLGPGEKSRFSGFARPETPKDARP